LEDHRRFELRPPGLRIPRSTVDASGPKAVTDGLPSRSSRTRSPPSPFRLRRGSLLSLRERRLADPGGLEPPAAGLKVPCPADPGFVRSGSNRHKVLIGAAASRPRLCRVLMLISCVSGRCVVACRAVARGCICLPSPFGLRRGSLHSLRERRLVDPHGNDPRSAGYRPAALPLSYRSAVGASERERSSSLRHVTAALCH
jgi:hypothetical protein